MVFFGQSLTFSIDIEKSNTVINRPEALAGGPNTVLLYMASIGNISTHTFPNERLD